MTHRAHNTHTEKMEQAIRVLLDMSRREIESGIARPPIRCRPPQGPTDANPLAGRVIALDHGTYVEYTRFENDGTIHVERHNKPSTFPFHHRGT